MNGLKMETIKVSKTKFIDSAKIQDIKNLIRQISSNTSVKDDEYKQQEKLSIIALLKNTLQDYQTYSLNIIKLQDELNQIYGDIYELEYEDPDDYRVPTLYDEANKKRDELEYFKNLLKDCANTFEFLKKDAVKFIPYRMPRLFKGGTKRKNKKRKKTRRFRMRVK